MPPDPSFGQLPPVIVLHQSLGLHEDEFNEFKEIPGTNPVKTIKNEVEDYVVGFLNGRGGRIF